MAYDFEVDGIYYDVISSTDKTVEITNPEVAKREDGSANVISKSPYSGDFVIPSSVIYNGENYTVSNIDTYCFYSNTDLTSVIIPNSVQVIEYGAFSDCTGLRTVVVPNGVTEIASRAFYNCSGLTSLAIPSTVTSIGSYYTFSNCTGRLILNCNVPSASNSNSGVFYDSKFSTIEIGPDVTSIGAYSFSGCKKLYRVYNGSSLNIVAGASTNGSVGYYANVIFTNWAKDGDYVLTTDTEGKTLVCEYLGTDESIVLPSVEGIADYAFSGASFISSVQNPNTLTSIGKYAFNGCSALSTINIPSSVVSVEDYAFSGCTNLPVYNNACYADTYLIKVTDKTSSSFNFKEGVRFIGIEAFRGYSSLQSLVIPDGVLSIGQNAFYDCTSLTTIDLPNSVKSLGKGVFSDCTGLLSAKIGDEVSIIDNSAFYNCSELKTISLGKNIKEIGENAFRYCQKMEEVNLDNTSLFNIGDNAFSGCTSLTDITLPQTLQEIGYGAFSGAGLKSLVIPNSVISLGEYAFNCRLQDVTIGNSITHLPRGVFGSVKNVSFAENSSLKVIGEEAFSNSSFSSLVLPNSVDSIMSKAFSGCSSLKEIELPQDISYIADGAFDGCTFNEPFYTNKQFIFMPRSYAGTYSIPDGIENIVGNAFSNCSYLTMVEIPSSVIRIGDNAFSSCYKLVSVNIPSSVKEIGRNAFYSDSYLTELILNEGLEKIGDNAFYGCSSLNNFVIPSSVLSIGQQVFVSTGWYKNQSDGWLYKDNCLLGSKGSFTTDDFAIQDGTRVIANSAIGNRVSSVTIPNTVKTIGENAFAYNSKFKYINIPNSVETIEEYAFNQCTYLTLVTFGNSVRRIDNRAFWGCKGLISIDLPNSVEFIGNEAFYGCSGLKKIDIPRSVLSIGEKAFSDCNYLTDVSVHWESPLPINNKTFTSVISTTLHVPHNTENLYKKANGWSDFGLFDSSAYNVMYSDKDGNIVNDYLSNGDSFQIVENDYQQINILAGANLSMLTYTRNYSNTKWQSLYVPFAMRYEDWKDEYDVAYINSVRQYDNDNDGVIDETIMDVLQITGGELYPNMPYMIRAKSTGSKTITLNNAILYQTEVNSVSCSTILSEFTFTGTYSTIDATTMLSNNYYAMGGGGLIKTNGTSSLKPFRWYMGITSRSPIFNAETDSPARISINVIGEDCDGETSIYEVAREEEFEDEIFNLNGQKQDASEPLKPGLYIKNGKKIMIR